MSFIKAFFFLSVLRLPPPLRVGPFCVRAFGAGAAAAAQGSREGFIAGGSKVFEGVDGQDGRGDQEGPGPQQVKKERL